MDGLDVELKIYFLFTGGLVSFESTLLHFTPSLYMLFNCVHCLFSSHGPRFYFFWFFIRGFRLGGNEVGFVRF